MKKYKHYIRGIEISLLCLVITGMVAGLLKIYESSQQDSAYKLNEHRVYIEAEQLKLSSDDIHGNTVPSGDLVESVADTQIDFSHPEKGIFFIRYAGDKNALQVWVEKNDSGERVEYPCPANGKWICLPLPFGAGEYTVTANPYDENDHVSHGEDRAVFTLNASYEDEAEPFRYANLFSDFDANSFEVKMAYVIENKMQEKLGRAPTAKELTDEIVYFIHKYIRGDSSVTETRKDDGSFYYFPDPEKTIDDARGSCADKAALVAAMLKSQGIPVRVHYGYIKNTGMYGNKRVYHAWLNVRLDGKWVMYDPTFAEAEINENETPEHVTYLYDTESYQ